MSAETNDATLDQDAAPAEDTRVWLYIGDGEYLAGLPATDLSAADLAAHGYTPAQLAEHPALYMPPTGPHGQAAVRVARAEAALAAVRDGDDLAAIVAAQDALAAARSARRALTPEETARPKADAPAPGPAQTGPRRRPGAPAAAPDPLPITPAPVGEAAAPAPGPGEEVLSDDRRE